ncbi:MAG: M48 family metallopeptidase [Gammaproteobacteria bacterium]|nr:M48 family metallopeptidase [Gammaproteobacteria bacterium]MDH5617300.1 M48 family metallopeptidase [Gammaproteobacteria bacterium]
MNFFAAQDQARKASRRLVLAYIVATVLIVAGVTLIVTYALFSTSRTAWDVTFWSYTANNWAIPAVVALLTTMFILGASLFKTAVLSSGGGAVATQMGGTLVPADVQDPLRRQLRNVVEEMAIASGVPVPEIYVLEEESSINAFAAGFSPSDAAVAVTRGTLELLDRDELQGVIAHEFSHILNGDMRLNIRLMGVLFGIMVLGLIGRLIVRGGYHASIVSSRRDRGAPVVLVVGLGLAVLGGIGMFFARVIKAGVSRQREYLADASAVQFTRQSDGIANALKKIGGYSQGSLIQAADPEEVSHMLFGSGSKLAGIFATHPPLVERIQALDPSFKEADFPRVDPRKLGIPSHDGGEAASAFAGDITTALASGGAQVLAESIAETVGKPENEHVAYAQHLRQSIPESLYAAAHSSGFAYLLTIALILDRSGRATERQLALAREQLGAERAKLLRRYFDELASTGAEYRLPLLGIAFPALKLRPVQELSYLVSLTTRMIEIDGKIDLYEYCFHRILMSNIGKAVDPSGRRRALRANRRDLQAAAIGLLRVLADYGHDEGDEREAAFATGVATLGAWAQDYASEFDRNYTVEVLDHSLDVLLGLNSKGKESLLRAVSATAAHDGKLSVTEAELIRAVCATLDYPLPPILVHKSRS